MSDRCHTHKCRACRKCHDNPPISASTGDHTRLRELAQKVASPQWSQRGRRVNSEDWDYISAASPDVVLALLDEVDALRAKVARVQRQPKQPDQWRVITATDDRPWPCTIVDQDDKSLLASSNGTPVIRSRDLADRIAAALNASDKIAAVLADPDDGGES